MARRSWIPGADTEKKKEPVQCYLCGKAVMPNYITRRIEPRLATRFHGKPVSICIYCAEEWDERFPGTKVAEEQPAPAPEEEELLAPEEAFEEPVREQEAPLTKRQAERLAWYSNAKPVPGYDVKAAILRDDALGAVAHKADELGLSYGYYIVRQYEKNH